MTDDLMDKIIKNEQNKCVIMARYYTTAAKNEDDRLLQTLFYCLADAYTSAAAEIDSVAVEVRYRMGGWKTKLL